MLKLSKNLNNLSDKQIRQIDKNLNIIEAKISELRNILNLNEEKNKTLYCVNTRLAKEFVEGVFDGKSMMDTSGKKYPVPENYASKSKLVCGDKLKLVIADDGTYIFKLISPIERKRETGTIQEVHGKISVVVNDKKYKILKASLVYFKLKIGDRVTVLLPVGTECTWAVIENKLE